MHIQAVVVGAARLLPVLARPVKAGFPSPADDYVERGIDLNDLLISNRPATFLVKVDGDSMVGKGLFDGDLAVVDRSLDPRDGDVVVVDVDGERSFKVWSTVAGRPKLSFANLRYPAFETNMAAEIEVWGVVCGSVNPRRRAIR
ncbi:translesion error-prone DNA polymerase V autoproteolytic subunit [Micromonospora sp. STR1s_5]|nr:translesion error-prone DNA polymerase V autoproteolytic subunit [Micromonospora sp. STR1s_5]